jgi:hypothetical protein
LKIDPLIKLGEPASGLKSLPQKGTDSVSRGLNNPDQLQISSLAKRKYQTWINRSATQIGQIYSLSKDLLQLSRYLQQQLTLASKHYNNIHRSDIRVLDRVATVDRLKAVALDCKSISLDWNTKLDKMQHILYQCKSNSIPYARQLVFSNLHALKMDMQIFSLSESLYILDRIQWNPQEDMDLLNKKQGLITIINTRAEKELKAMPALAIASNIDHETVYELIRELRGGSAIKEHNQLSASEIVSIIINKY